MSSLNMSSDKVPEEVYRRLIRLIVRRTTGERPDPTHPDPGKKKKAVQLSARS